jgi:hypothetical protein
LLLTNTDDFSAHIVLSDNIGGAQASGNIFGQGARLLLVPTSDAPTLQSGWAGVFRFLWDTGQGNGFVISEVLHGYAPLTAPIHYVNITWATQIPVGPQQTVHEQRCEPQNVEVTGSDGSVAPLRVCRADDLNGFPVQIVPIAGTNTLTLELSQVRLEAQPAELFNPPEGFTRYSSGEAMVHDLVLRQKLQLYQPGGGGSETPSRRRH